MLDENLFLSIAMAWTLLATGQIEGVEPRLQAVERKVGVRAEDAQAAASLTLAEKGALAEVLCIRTSLAFNQLDLGRMRALSGQALAYLEEGLDGSFSTNLSLCGVIAFDLALGYEYGGETAAAISAFEEAIELTRVDENIHLLPMCISHLAQLHVLCGHLRAAMEVYERGLHIAEGEAPSPLSGMAYTGAAQVLYEWNELDRAVDYLEQGLALGKQWSQWEILWAGYAGLADVDWVRGRPDQARARLQALTEQVRHLGMQWAIPAVEAHRALLAVRQGDLSTAARWAATCEIRADQPILYPQEPYALILARVKLLQGELADAAQLVDRLLAVNEGAERWGRVIALLTLRALIAEAQGRRDAAQTALTRALEMAEPEGYIRTFVDEGSPLRDLLTTLDGPSAYVGELLDAFGERRPVPASPAANPAPHPVLVEPLTDREVDVLALIARGLTNQEIADQLVISVNTVKTHAKHIYDKLDVRNRAEATTRAIERDLI
jgi:LuxR family maltose regulon positive regulatory protein